MNLDVANMSNVANLDPPACAAADVADSNRAGVPGTSSGAHASADSQPHSVVDVHAGGPSTVDSHAGPHLVVNAPPEVPSGARVDAGPSTYATIDGHSGSPPVVDGHAKGADPGCAPTVPAGFDARAISAAPDTAAPSGPRTRLQNNIRQPKIYTDGTIRYACLTHSGEPESLAEAL
jgi:hypothetical protein